MLAAHLNEGFVRPLHNSLATNIDPRSCRHLTKHHQAFPVELAKVFPGGPMRHKIRVGDQDAGRIGVRSKNANRLARLNQQRLIGLQYPQRSYDCIVGIPITRRLADATVNDEIFGPLGNLGIEIVHQHAQRSFGQPAFRLQFGSRWRFDDSVFIHCYGFSISRKVRSGCPDDASARMSQVVRATRFCE